MGAEPMARSDCGPRALEWRPTVFLGLTCLSLTFCLAVANWQLSWRDKVGQPLVLHSRVLAHEAWAPYQYHGYVPAVVCRFAADHLGLDLAVAFAVWCGLGYLLVMLGVWYWLRALGHGAAGVLLGLLAMATFAYYMLPDAGDHPSDTYGAALFALSLGLLARNRTWAVCLVSLIAGLLWSKQVFIGPIILLVDAGAGNWRRGLLRGWLATMCAAIGPLIYLAAFGYRPNVPEGTLSIAAAIAALPKSLLFHFGLALPAVMSYLLLRRQLPAVLRAATAIYPLMLLAYASQHLLLHEMRSWWITTPVFAALLAAWVLPWTGEQSDP